MNVPHTGQTEHINAMQWMRSTFSKMMNISDQVLNDLHPFIVSLAQVTQTSLQNLRLN